MNDTPNQAANFRKHVNRGEGFTHHPEDDCDPQAGENQGITPPHLRNMGNLPTPRQSHDLRSSATTEAEGGATCKTCGGTVPNHVPSILDPQGIGHPNHSVEAQDIHKGETSRANDDPSEQQAKSATSGLDEILDNCHSTHCRVNVDPENCICNIAEAKAKIEADYIPRARVMERKEGYDPNRLGSWIFIGDKARLDNLDELYWSYVMETVAEVDPNVKLEYAKQCMPSASFGQVGIFKTLARADQRAKERLAALQQEATDAQD